LPSYFSEIKKKILISCPDEDITQKRLDYYLSPPGITVEVKRLYDKEDIEKREKRNRIQSALNELTSKEHTLNAVIFFNILGISILNEGKRRMLQKKFLKQLKAICGVLKLIMLGALK
jgi:hypothetical protein